MLLFDKDLNWNKTYGIYPDIRDKNVKRYLFRVYAKDLCPCNSVQVEFYQHFTKIR